MKTKELVKQIESLDEESQEYLINIVSASIRGYKMLIKQKNRTDNFDISYIIATEATFNRWHDPKIQPDWAGVSVPDLIEAKEKELLRQTIKNIRNGNSLCCIRR